jgi:hypothetical protein
VPRAARWKAPYIYNPSETLGQATTRALGMRDERLWVWVAMAVNVGWFLALNVLCTIAMAVLSRARPILSSLPAPYFDLPQVLCILPASCVRL